MAAIDMSKPRPRPKSNSKFHRRRAREERVAVTLGAQGKRLGGWGVAPNPIKDLLRILSILSSHLESVILSRLGRRYHVPCLNKKTCG